MEYCGIVCFLSLLLVSSICSAPIESTTTVDGFALNNLESQKTFTFAVIPRMYGEATTVSFYQVDFPYEHCGQVQIDILDDGYVKRDYNKIAVICDAVSLCKFTATSGRGFHVVITMGKDVHGGSISARFAAASGTSVTRHSLYG